MPVVPCEEIRRRNLCCYQTVRFVSSGHTSLMFPLCPEERAVQALLGQVHGLHLTPVWDLGLRAPHGPLPQAKLASCSPHRVPVQEAGLVSGAGWLWIELLKEPG